MALAAALGGYFGSGGTASDAVVAMLLWLPLSVLLEFVIGWLWSRSRSVWPPAILHGGSNLVVASASSVSWARVARECRYPPDVRCVRTGRSLHRGSVDHA